MSNGDTWTPPPVKGTMRIFWKGILLVNAVVKGSRVERRHVTGNDGRVGSRGPMSWALVIGGIDTGAISLSDKLRIEVSGLAPFEVEVVSFDYRARLIECAAINPGPFLDQVRPTGEAKVDLGIVDPG